MHGPALDDMSEYLLSNYGECKRGEECTCRKLGWLGKHCPHWQPLGVTTLEQLREYHERRRK